MNTIAEVLEQLNNEKQNTEVEIEKNLEKQEENKDEEMVDEDGNKVDILKDLIRLEGELKSYLKEVDSLIDETKPFDALSVKC